MPRADADGALRSLEGRRTELNAYVSSLHDLRAPWGVSRVRGRAPSCSSFPSGRRPSVRFRGQVLAALDIRAARAGQRDPRRVRRPGRPDSATSSPSPWAAASLSSARRARRRPTSWSTTSGVTRCRRRSTPLRARRGRHRPSAGGDHRRLAEPARPLATNGRGARAASIQRSSSTIPRQLAEAMAPAGRGLVARLAASLRQRRLQAARAHGCGEATWRSSAAATLELLRRAQAAAALVSDLRRRRLPAASAGAETSTAWKRVLARSGAAARRARAGARPCTISPSVPTPELRALLDGLVADRATLVEAPAAGTGCRRHSTLPAWPSCSPSSRRRNANANLAADVFQLRLAALDPRPARACRPARRRRSSAEHHDRVRRGVPGRRPPATSRRRRRASVGSVPSARRRLATSSATRPAIVQHQANLKRRPHARPRPRPQHAPTSCSR